MLAVWVRQDDHYNLQDSELPTQKWCPLLLGSLVLRTTYSYIQGARATTNAPPSVDRAFLCQVTLYASCVRREMRLQMKSGRSVTSPPARKSMFNAHKFYMSLVGDQISDYPESRRSVSQLRTNKLSVLSLHCQSPRYEEGISITRPSKMKWHIMVCDNHSINLI
jgi:hypothetical protein